MITKQQVDLWRIKDASFQMDYEFLNNQVHRYMDSEEYELICKAYDYYEGKHDILLDGHGRMQAGADGHMEPVSNGYDKRLVDNQYARCIDQKRNFLLGRPFSFDATDEVYGKKLEEVFDDELRADISETGTHSLIAREVYWYLHYSDKGELKFKRLDRRQTLVIWNDEEEKDPYGFIRFYDQYYYEGKTEKKEYHLDFYEPDGVTSWVDGNPVSEKRPYNYNSQGQAIDLWGGKLPLIVWKSSPWNKIGLLEVKGLQDALNQLKSQVANISLEDSRSTLLWIENYGGGGVELDIYGNPISARQVIQEDGIVYTETIDGVSGNVQTLSIEFEPEKRLQVIEMLRRSIIENMRGFDVKDLRDASAPNQMNIQGIYSEMEQDALQMEGEYKSAFQDLLYFINIYIKAEGKGATPVFNKNMEMDDSIVITNIMNSRQLLPDKFLVGQHPWVKNVQEIMEMKEEENKAMFDSLINNSSQIDPLTGQGRSKPFNSISDDGVDANGEPRVD